MPIVVEVFNTSPKHMNHAGLRANFGLLELLAKPTGLGMTQPDFAI
jgi:hypothetical protein